MDEAYPPIRLEATIEVACSPQEVWRYLGAFEEGEVWAPGITEPRPTGRPGTTSASDPDGRSGTGAFSAWSRS